MNNLPKESVDKPRMPLDNRKKPTGFQQIQGFLNAVAGQLQNLQKQVLELQQAQAFTSCAIAALMKKGMVTSDEIQAAYESAKSEAGKANAEPDGVQSSGRDDTAGNRSGGGEPESVPDTCNDTTAGVPASVPVSGDTPPEGAASDPAPSAGSV